MKNALILVNRQKTQSKALAAEVAAELKKLKIRSKTADSALVAPGPVYDLIITLGGDGTVLRAARFFAESGALIFPINLGTLGFISAIQEESWKEAFAGVFEGKAVLSEKLMLEIEVRRAGESIFSSFCLNDAVISAGRAGKMIRLDAVLGMLPIGSYRADGLIASTPTGSTAYSAAAGGPILDPGVEAFIITPVCPFSLTHRPLVLDGNNVLQVNVSAGQRSDIVLTCDGQLSFSLLSGDIVTIKKAPFKARLVASGREAFYRALGSKLSWLGDAAVRKGSANA
jgi:NAD+ kinase